MTTFISVLKFIAVNCMLFCNTNTVPKKLLEHTAYVSEVTIGHCINKGGAIKGFVHRNDAHEVKDWEY